MFTETDVPDDKILCPRVIEPQSPCIEHPELVGDKTPLLFAVLGRLSPGAGYHEPSARDARRRIIAVFDADLRA